jgi:hypothetical protein
LGDGGKDGIPSNCHGEDVREEVMAYGHAERNLALIRQLEAETSQLLATVTQPDPEQSAWMLEASPDK